MRRTVPHHHQTARGDWSALHQLESGRKPATVWKDPLLPVETLWTAARGLRSRLAMALSNVGTVGRSSNSR